MLELIAFIEKNLNRERLEKISSSVIDAYRSEDDVTLKSYGSALSIDSTGDRKRLFYRIIQQLHPDRFPVISNEFRKAKSRSDEDELKRIKKLLEIRLKSAEIIAERFGYEHHETYYASPETGEFADYDSGEDIYEDFGDRGFIGAVKDVIFGNHNFHIEPADLGQIDGSLDLGFCGLDDIEGIEYCRNVRALNISGNDISNIWELQHLDQLEELYAADNIIRDIEILEGLDRLEIIDLSGNDIEDISPLLKMRGLKFVDIRNNPVSGYSLIEQLEAEDIIVLR